MTKPATQAERLTRIETLLEQAVVHRAEDRAGMKQAIDDIATDVKAIKADVEAVKADVRADKAELAALKNKGVGLLIGAGLAGGATWEAVKAVFGVIGK